MNNEVNDIIDEWPQPKPIFVKSLELPDMVPELLTPKLYDFCEDVSNDTNSSIANCAVPLLCALGAIIGSKVGIFAEQNSNYFEVANLWGIVLGDASTRKSPAADIMKSYLQDIEHSYAAENANIELQYYHDLEVKQKNLKQLSKSTSPNSMQIAQLSAEVNALISNGCPKKRLLTSDSTIEKLQMLMLANPRGIIFYKDEITSLFNELRSEIKDTYRTFLMESHKSFSGFNIDRIGRGSIHIPRINLSMFGTAQTQLFKDIINQWYGKYKVDGFFARISLITVSKRLPPRKLKPPLNPDIRDYMTKLMLELDQYRPEDSISRNGMRTNSAGILGLTLSVKAQELFNQYSYKLDTLLDSDNIQSELLKAHLAKQPSTVLKLALILHLVDNHDTFSPIQINDATMIRALAWSEYLYPHLVFMYSATSMIENPAEVTMALAILRKIAENKITNGMTISMIIKKNWSQFNDKALIEEGMNVLVNHDWIEMVDSDTSLGGFPTIKIHVNPKAAALLLDEGDYIAKSKGNYKTKYLDMLSTLS